MYSLVAAPMGSRIGVVAARSSSSQVLVTVAPKVWRNGKAAVHVLDQWPAGKHLDLTLYETDRLHVLHPTGDVEAMLTAMLSASKVSGELPYELSWDTSLLAPDVVSGRLTVTPSAISNLARSETSNLLRLFQHVDLLYPRSENLIGRAARSPLHRPLTSRMFLDEVERRAAQARRGYRTIAEDRVSIRGRVESRSLARFAATGQPQLRCRYDELTESTVLLGVIASALELLADGRGPTSILPGVYSELQLRHDAVRLRRALAEVPAFSVHEAVARGSRLRLDRLDRAWADALRFALVLLSNQEILAADRGHGDFKPLEISAKTDKIWEWIVNAALSRTAFEDVLAQGKAQSGYNEDPWISYPRGVVESQPDNIALREREVCIIDAKYKLPKGATPDRGDQYQMFAYSHLVRATGREVRAAVLVYPGEGARRIWHRGRDQTLSPVQLFSVQLPFPMPDDLVTGRTWARYLERVAIRLESQLGMVREALLRLPA